MRVFKSKQKQNLVVFIEPSEAKYDIFLKYGNMILNRFCIDEDAAFELSGVNFFKRRETEFGYRLLSYSNPRDIELKRKEKGTEYSFLPLKGNCFIRFCLYIQPISFQESRIKK